MVLGRAIGADGDRDAVLARIFDGRLRDAPAYLERFLERLGVRTQFESYGVSQSEAERMLDHVGFAGNVAVGVAMPMQRQRPLGEGSVDGDAETDGAGVAWSGAPVAPRTPPVRLARTGEKTIIRQIVAIAKAPSTTELTSPRVSKSVMG